MAVTKERGVEMVESVALRGEEKLQGSSNYHTWSIKMKIILQSKRLLRLT